MVTTNMLDLRLAGSTGTGTFVGHTSLTLVTPILGTPTSGNLSNCTGLPISTGVSGIDSNVLTWMITPSSTNLAAAVTGETGTGALVFATSPTLVSPLLGTPTSGNLANCTGLVVAGGGTGNSTFTAYSIIAAGTTAQGAFQNVNGLGTATQVLTSNGPSALPTWEDAGGGSGGGGGTFGTLVSTTSVASAAFTGLPANIKQITIILASISFVNSSANTTLQIGDSGGLETTGYVSTAYDTTTSTSTAHFILNDNSNNTLNGRITLTRLDTGSNVWILSGVTSRASTIQTLSGSKSLTGELDRLTVSCSVNNFSAGSVNIYYET